MIFHVLIHIKRVEFLAVEARKEHAYHKTKVERFHVCPLLFHAKIDVVVIRTKVFCGELGAIHLVIVVHNGLQLVCFARALISKPACAHTRMDIVLTAVCCVCKHCPDSNLGFKTLKNLIISNEGGHRLHRKECIKLPVEC